MNNILDMQKQAQQDDRAQIMPKFPITTQQKPSMSTKLIKIAELFELDVLSEEEALKACKVIIGQHAKKQGRTEDNAKRSMPKDAIIGTGISDAKMTSERLGNNP